MNLKDNEKSQHLLNKLKEVEDEVMLDRMTFEKIQAMVNKEEYNEKKVYEENPQSEIQYVVRNRPSGRDFKEKDYFPYR